MAASEKIARGHSMDRRDTLNEVSRRLFSKNGPDPFFRKSLSRWLRKTQNRIWDSCRFFLTGTCLVIILSNFDRAHSQESRPHREVQANCDGDNAPPVEKQKKSAVAQKDAGFQSGSSRKNTPQQIFRPEDLRRRHPDDRLEEAGIRIFESKRLKLYTDIDPEIAQTLPKLVDQLYIALEAYFGPMPPDRANTDFQVSGYLMRDMALFREHGLMPEEIVISHGRHRRNEFWMREQNFDYYRRHLLFHEVTHCFMTYMPDIDIPVWYVEGMAEFFGTHRVDSRADLRTTFQVMPDSPIGFSGFGRIPTIREDVAANQAQSIEAIRSYDPATFLKINQYSWSWALCAFLDSTPRYHKRFRSLGKYTQGTQYNRLFDELFVEDRRQLDTEWALFSNNLQYGYDVVRSAIDFQPGSELTAAAPKKMVEVDADRGWQSSGVRVIEGSKYRITATGRFSLGKVPKPWISEPQGISFRYFEGNPIGVLMGSIRNEEGAAGGSNESMLRVVKFGADYEFEAHTTGTLYLRLNDAWNSLADNDGHASVTIEGTGN